MRKVKINFHGFLKDLIPETIEGNFNSLHDVLVYISNNYKQLKAPLNIGRYCVEIPEYTTKESIFCNLHTDNIDIYPHKKMSKSAGMGQVIVGAVMVAVVVAAVALTGPAGAFASASAFASAAGSFGTAVAVSGALMMVTGVMTYFTTPRIKNTADHSDGQNKYLGAPGNTTANGTPIPIGYGKYKVSGHYLSMNISSSSVVIVGDK